MLEGSDYGFRLGSFDPTLPVVIDPLLQSTYLGGAGFDFIQDDAITVDPSSGDVLVAGVTDSGDFPGTLAGAQPAFVASGDGFVVRLDRALTTFLQATYLGGEGLDIAQGIAVHPVSGEVFVTGSTDSTDFPGTSGGAQAAYGGGAVDGFVARLDRTLTSLLQATYLGGRGFDRCFRISLLSNGGEVIVAGLTGSEGGAQAANGGGEYDGFLARLNATLTTLLQATYLGGAGEDVVLCLAVHPSSGDVLAAGSTTSTDFPATAGGAQPVSRSNGDAFATRLNPGLTALLQTTYLGGGDLDFARGLVAHPTTGEVLVAGFTQSIDFPGTAGGAQSEFPGGLFSGFASRLDSALTELIQSTFLGGISGGGQVSAAAVHPSSGELLLAGATISTDFPATAGGAQAENGGDVDGVVSRLDPSLTAIRQSTYLGGSTEDEIWALTVDPTSGEILVAGWTDSVDLPVTTGVAQPGFSGEFIDAFVARLTADLAAPPMERLPPLPVRRPSPALPTIPPRD